MTDNELMQDCKSTPYWWEDVPRPVLPELALPSTVDVAVVGAGYTGLHAALQTVRGGRSTLVFDAEDAGWGCSSRNGGQVSTSIKPTYELLARRHGQKRAFDILNEGQKSLAWIAQFIGAERIDCDFRRVGRFHAAHNAAQYEALAARVGSQPKGLEVDAFMVPRDRQHEELGTDLYWGGAVYTQHCSVHPARYHQGLLDRVLASGGQVASRCPVLQISRSDGLFRLRTPRGEVMARDVVIATNGYTGNLTPWLRRRVIPIGSYMIATEPVPAQLMDRLFPTDRIVSDTRKVVYYYRCTPDRSRILFGGRVSHQETDPRISGPKLHADMVRLFPQLRETRISHSWCGFVAYTFDELMHIGKHDGMHYAMGYCGAGVGTSSYFGMRLGQQVLGLKEGRTALDDLAFQTRPLYTGNPWFLAPSVAYYRWRDSRPV
ncbi:MAG: FAD-binding oxidoreductase [Rhodoferax sp.]|nr:FAD-binding oxidoreductase [Rhodoferax sp.]MBP8672421.1 FAD-binding oxidoreductase [Sphingobium sp.]HQX58547.1 FAD-binding oxidoreductase [Burkholderiaceae bacterium]MBP9929496.1 FAD-binding oxidoreductase [Rhodoferax sp.]HQZ05204.1 FAD-binding oxidoreductase [Burkholderiaceae bacterium]